MNALALAAERAEPSAGGTIVKRPRIGLLRPWGSSMDEGWTRWVMEQYGFDLVTLRPADFRSPLAAKVDVVIITEDGRLPVEGPAAGAGERRRETPGAGAAPYGPIRGRRLGRGSRAFEQFIRAGGTLVCLGGASTFAISQFRLPVSNVIAGLKPEDYFLRGSIVEVTADTTHPVMDGMPEAAMVFVDGSPVFETLEGFKGRVLAKYQDSGSPLLIRISDWRVVPARQGGGARRRARPGARRAAWLPPPVARSSFGTLRVLFNAALSPVRRGSR